MFNAKKLMIFALVALVSVAGCKKDDDDDDKVVLEPILLDCDYFQTDRVLEDDPDRPVDFIVPCVASVSGNIVIKEGVVIEGSAAKKVVFTAVNKVKGAWRGIIYFSNSTQNQIDHAEISYAGGNSFNSNNDRGNLICYNCKLSVTNSLIDNGKEHGFNAVYNSCDITAFNNNTLTDNDKYPVFSLVRYGFAYNSSNTFTGNGSNYVFLEGGQVINGNHTWEKLDVPYIVEKTLRIGDNQSLTVEAGANLLFDSDASIWVDEGGYLSVSGQASNIVTLSGLVAQPGTWKGIINYSADQRNVVNNAEIAHAGGNSHNSNGDLGTIIVWADAYQKVSNSTLRDNAPTAPCAINAPYSDEVLVLENITLINITTEECQ